MDNGLNGLLLERLRTVGVSPEAGAHRLCWTLVDLIETEVGTDNATALVRAFAAQMIEDRVQPTTALELLHFISANIQICPIRK